MRASGTISALGIALIAVFVVAAAGCGDDGGGAPAGDPMVERGRAVYANVCIACHNADPSQDGSLGPAVAGASLELLEARVLRGEYPPGYTPKRPSGAMPKYTYLAEALPAIAAYLAAADH